jgi:hypothetical protein
MFRWCLEMIPLNTQHLHGALTLQLLGDHLDHSAVPLIAVLSNTIFNLLPDCNQAMGLGSFGNTVANLIGELSFGCHQM